MGLPIWRDPAEKLSAPPPDRTAGLRSSIRRRPSIHGRHSTNPRSRLAREATGLPPRFERSPPPSVGFNGLRNPRRGEARGVPPISSLLEAADRSSLPPPVPEPRSFSRLMAGGDDNNDSTNDNDADNTSGRRYAARMLLQQREARRSRMGDLRERYASHLANGPDNEQSNTNEPTVSASWREPDGPLPAREATPPSAPRYAILTSPGEMLRAAPSGDEYQNYRPQSPDFAATRRHTLPTPPLDTSGPEDGPLIQDVDVARPRTNRRSHPLSSTWRVGSPSINGLGDRNRSPTPAGDGWEVIRTTITPDETLPSADSSFASTAASRSFNAPTNDTQITEPEISSSAQSRPDSSEQHRTESASSLDLDDLACTDEDLYNTEAFASDMWYHEMRTPEGRARIARHSEIHHVQGSRFAHSWEPERVDIGFRLIEEALETDEGRHRVLQIRQDAPENLEHFNTLLSASRRSAAANEAQDRHESRRSLDLSGSQPPSPRPDLYNQREVRNAIEAAYQQTQEYLNVFRTQTQQLSPTSPPPEYEAPASSVPDIDTATSQDGPLPHPVSPPSLRSEREVSEALLSGDVQDLDSMRRVIERIAQRDDVPESWWMSMGLNLSRARPRERSAERRRIIDGVHAEANRVRTGRIERGSSRL